MLGAAVELSEEVVQQVWERGALSETNDRHRWRKDQFGAWMGRQEYRNRESEYGWDIVALLPSSHNEPANLIPLQWQNSLAHSNSSFRPVTADGKHNSQV